MFKLRKSSASSLVGNSAHPIRPPVQAKLFEAPPTKIVRSAIRGHEAMLA